MRAVPTLTATLAIGTALWLTAPSAQALGFGRVSNVTELGQPLNFAAAVRLEPDEHLSRECVAAEVQSGDNKLHPQQVRVTLEGGADAADRSVRITTSTLIDEPVVTVSVTVGCTAKVTRRFVAFIDPPLINAARTAPAETPAPQRVDSQVAPIVTMVQGANGAASTPAPRRAERPAAPRARPRAPAQVVAGDSSGLAREPAPARAERPKRPTAPSRQPSVARAAPAGSRLQLETAAPAVAQSAAASTPLAGSASAAAAVAHAGLPAASAATPDAGAGALAIERQRIQSLEEGLTKLRGDAQATHAAMIAMQAQLKATESERYANPLVYALAWLSALLALAVAGLWWRQSRVRNAPHWWAGPAPAPGGPSTRSGAAPAEPGLSAPQPLGAPHTAADAFSMSPQIEEDEPLTAPSPTSGAPFVATAPAPPRELSVEELIDLEQQAEFFIVLGQDEAAIELLMSHVRNDGGISPLPYLKLLEIYRRRGEGDAYQRIRERFNRRFNSYAPDWDADPQQGRALEGYPDTIARLQQLWATPVRVMETLDASLFRRNKTDGTFDLPAYRELLFLYSIARDLAEHAGVLPTTRVDLLLPLDDPGQEPISRLSATTPSGESPNSEMMTLPIDLDVSFGPGGTQEVETVPSALRRSSRSQFSTDSVFLDFNLDEAAKPPKTGGTR